MREGLNILRTVNLRDKLQEVEAQTLIITGERDRLVPLAAAQLLAQGINQSQLQIIKGASHAPFISHQALFVSDVEKFLSRKS